MSRAFLIGMIVFLALAYILSIFIFYQGYNKRDANGKRLMDEPVNESTRTDRMGAGEILIYVLMLAAAVFFAMQIMHRGVLFPSAAAIIIRSVILVPIMAFFNARKRTGKAVVALYASLIFVLFCTMCYLIIGLPVKAPVLELNNTEIVLGQTAVSEIMESGLDIYFVKEHTASHDYEEFPYSEQFIKYSDEMDISVDKGYHNNPYTIANITYSSALLAKDDILLASVTFFGSMSEEKPLKDCSIVNLYISDRLTAPERKGEISVKLNGEDLSSKIDTVNMKKAFGNKILRPDEIETEKRCRISWNSRSEFLFFNSYSAVIHMDDEGMMSSIEIDCQIAREAD